MCVRAKQLERRTIPYYIFNVCNWHYANIMRIIIVRLNAWLCARSVLFASRVYKYTIIDGSDHALWHPKMERQTPVHFHQRGECRVKCFFGANELKTITARAFKLEVTFDLADANHLNWSGHTKNKSIWTNARYRALCHPHAITGSAACS